MWASGPPRCGRSEGEAMLQDVNTRVIPRSSVERVMRRRDAIGAAALAALGLIASEPGRDAVDAAKKEKKRKKDKTGKNKQDASSIGREVVHVAQKYKGAKYVWGGASPKGFDCSGFTWYVYKKAANMDITRGVEEQWKHGHSVRGGKWKPGDLVFFENTFEHGLSHVGIFIKGNDFIH